MKPFQSLLGAALVAAAVCAPAQSSFRDFTDAVDATLDAARESREQNAAKTDVRAIFAKAKAAADNDDKLNLCGFYTGMSATDARTLVDHYALKDGEWTIEGDPVYNIHLSLKGVRRVTKGGNTFDELAQAVANRVGSMKQDWETDVYRLKTIDGISVTMSETTGFAMFDMGAKDDSERTAERKVREEREASERKALEAERKALETREDAERKAAENKAKERAIQAASSPAVKAVAESILASMVEIPDKDFKLGKTEVTQAQWEAIMGENPSRFKGENNPVENVSWNDCQGFLSLLNSIPVVKDSGLTFRLPAEEEWELACRAGSTKDYCRLADGTDITKDTLGQVAWFNDNSDNMTHPVGQKQPNAFGLYDMHGNVWEWTSTAFDNDPVFCYRVFRGGSWIRQSELCGSSSRNWDRPSNRDFNLGFRLCTSRRVD